MFFFGGAAPNGLDPGARDRVRFPHGHQPPLVRAGSRVVTALALTLLEPAADVAVAEPMGWPGALVAVAVIIALAVVAWKFMDVL